MNFEHKTRLFAHSHMPEYRESGDFSVILCRFFVKYLVFDLYLLQVAAHANSYRLLNIISITVPPLRERKEDLPILIDHFIKKHHHGENPPRLKPEQLEQLVRYDWPGNVRKLENIIQRKIALPQDMDFAFCLERRAPSRKARAWHGHANGRR